jgi:hypothetical protein
MHGATLKNKPFLFLKMNSGNVDRYFSRGSEKVPPINKSDTLPREPPSSAINTMSFDAKHFGHMLQHFTEICGIGYSTYTGRSKGLCEPDDYNTESYK